MKHHAAERCADAAALLAEADPQPAPDKPARAVAVTLPGKTPGRLPEVVIGELVALIDEGVTPLVRYPGQPGLAALRARSVIDLQGKHIGRSMVLAFEAGDPSRPLVMGVLRQAQGGAAVEVPGQVQVDTDGERLLVTARDQLVLRCGKASITLTKAGKVLVQGTFVSSRSTGVNRIKGGSVQLN